MSSSYISKAYLSSHFTNPDLRQSFSFNYTLIPPPSTDDSSLPTSSASPFTANPITGLTPISIYKQRRKNQVDFHVTLTSFSVIENNTYTDKNLSISWNTTTVTYKIGNYSEEIASWISINSTTGVLNISSPEVLDDKNYTFSLYSSVTGFVNPSVKNILLTVQNCISQNCNKWLNTSNSIWEVCNVKYILKSGNCELIEVPSAASEVWSFVSLSTTGASFGLVAIMGIINTASIATLWSMINQIQLYFLLLLTRADIPIDVKYVISGKSFAINLSQMLNIQNMNLFKSIIDVFDFIIDDPSLNSMNINTDSTFYNLSPMIIIVFPVMLFHFAVVILKRLFLNIKGKRKIKYLVSGIKWVLDKLFILLTFSWYIRYILEMNQLTLISSLYEITNFNTTQKYRIISLTFAFIAMFLCIILIVIITLISISSYEVVKNRHNKIGELFSGQKMQKKTKLYTSILLLRRMIFIILLLSLVSVRSWIVITILSLLQLWYLITIIIIRPFIKIRNNMIEIINEIYFFVLFISLINFNSKENWNSTVTMTYMWLLTSNSIVVFIIVFGKLFLVNI